MTSSEGGGTYWWAAPSSPFVVMGAGVTSSSLSVLVVVCSCHCCPLFVAVHRSLLSVFILVHRALLNHFASLALCLAMGDVNGGVVALVGWACVQSWPVVCVGGFRGCSLSFAGRCVLCASLLPL